ncbi:MAG: LysR family transcriptional regulator [Archangium gephyra]|uniref:LysR family transcriptional regulator n=1 Tax=Archangium gephyra TaxID=48 RepID=A0A2W5UVZ9_9BACT|nr:MAG: LysR family transcriptional regulator [Archangium gephyra]
MNLETIAALGYELTPSPLEVLTFHAATRVGDLVFTSGQIPVFGDVAVKGKVGADVDLPTAQKAAEICAVNCLRAALAVADAAEIERVVKLVGMVNVADGFNDTSSVINGASSFLNSAFPGQPSHARSAVGMVLPGDWAVEVELVLALKAG